MKTSGRFRSSLVYFTRFSFSLVSAVVRYCTLEVLILKLTALFKWIIKVYLRILILALLLFRDVSLFLLWKSFKNFMIDLAWLNMSYFSTSVLLNSSYNSSLMLETSVLRNTVEYCIFILYCIVQWSSDISMGIRISSRIC